jgi:phosphate transport system permease protein
MSIGLIIVVIFGLGVLGFVLSRQRASVFAGGTYRDIHSRPNYHGIYSFLWAAVPALLLIIAWASLKESYITPAVINSVAAEARPTAGLESQVFMNEVRDLASGEIQDSFNPASKDAAKVYARTDRQGNLVVGGLAVAFALLGMAYSYVSVKKDFRARTKVERFFMGLLLAASIVAILTTFGILFSLLFESARFFSKVSAWEFLTGLNWSPQEAIRSDQVGSSGSFGAVPLFWGTLFITLIAMIVAVPVGLMAAIYLTQYASRRVRSYLKPVLELLAGVPTVVYGFFAALTLAPKIREFGISIGIENASSESALAAGLVMGIMIIPFMSSLSDDALTAVPQAMKDGSLAMGATESETIKKVLIPAALPGIVGGFLLSVSRAIGETMIVVMAAGLAANMTINPFDSVTTVTTQIVALLTGDQEFDSAKTLSAFALGLVLFLVTLALNVFALRVVKKYREAYE